MTTPYDDLAYPALAFPQAHPDRLATHAALFGLPFAPGRPLPRAGRRRRRGRERHPDGPRLSGIDLRRLGPVGRGGAARPRDRRGARPDQHPADRGRPAGHRSRPGAVRLHHSARGLLLGSRSGAGGIIGPHPAPPGAERGRVRQLQCPPRLPRAPGRAGHAAVLGARHPGHGGAGRGRDGAAQRAHRRLPPRHPLSAR